jgi:hypothetical protein
MVHHSTAVCQRRTASQWAGKTNLVTPVSELVAATNDKDTTQIIVGADLGEVPPIRLLPGQAICSDGERRVSLRFREDVDGLQLASDNSVVALDLHASPEKRAIWNDPAVEDLGTIKLTLAKWSVMFRSSRRRRFERAV